MNAARRSRIRVHVGLAADTIAPVWPLASFVACNPLVGLQAMPFEHAVVHADGLFGHEIDDATERVNERVATWCAAFLDECEATWPMPYRERGFFVAWRALCPAEGFDVRTIEPRSDDALLASLDALQIREDETVAFLARELCTLPGWAGFIKRAAADAQSDRPPIDLVAYLAVRLHYVRRFGALQSDVPRPAAWLDTVALAAREDAYCGALTAAMRARPAQPANPQPDVQMIFCIDVRSEPLRRALEAEPGIQTLGFAGFFGFAVRARGFDEREASIAAPVLVRPKHEIEDRVQPSQVAGALGARSRRRGIADAYHCIEGQPVLSFALVEMLGPVGAFAMALRTFFPRVARRLRRRAKTTAGRLDVGVMSMAERALFAEVALRTMGLTRNFAPLVVICGHGGAAVNNPFASALDCGACGGNPGFINARVAATTLNDPALRAVLRERGIDIPAATIFIAADHDTTRDVIRFDTTTGDAELPPSFAEFVRACARAASTVRATRARTLPPPAIGSTQAAVRAEDWAQVRPEWGLARNAAIVIGPRSLTSHLDLGGRVFLHSYEPHDDADAFALEQILTAPLIVAQWINLHYLFATVDNARFGSGDKMLHNPVGGIGVVAGNGGDLRAGLPWQSVALAPDVAFHEAQRLLVIVCAPQSRIDAVIARQTLLQQLFNGKWMTLVAIDPVTGTHARYDGPATWNDLAPAPTKEPTWTAATA